MKFDPFSKAINLINMASNLIYLSRFENFIDYKDEDEENLQNNRPDNLRPFVILMI